MVGRWDGVSFFPLKIKKKKKLVIVPILFYIAHLFIDIYLRVVETVNRQREKEQVIKIEKVIEKRSNNIAIIIL